MKRILFFGLLCVMLLSMTGFTQSPAVSSMSMNQAHTYTVLVGSENTRQAVSLMAFYPNKVKIHVGDTVVWKANSHEIHTVSFLASTPMPDFLVNAPAGSASPLMINPLAGLPTPNDGTYDGSTYLNSGILSTDPGQIPAFKLTFTKEGTFEYVCIVHGMMMSGVVEVVGSSVWVPSPKQERLAGLRQMAKDWRTVPGVLAKANQQIVPATRNADGTWTRHVTVGYSSGVVDVMRFFPKTLNVRENDTVVWTLSKADIAPHTISFFNGHPDLPLVTPVTPPVPPLLLINPAVLFPSPAVMQGTPLNKTDFFNSGILLPDPNNTVSFTLKVGDIAGVLNYECILHDSSGMVGRLIVHDVDHDHD